MAVFGSPLLTASCTFFHCSGRGWAAVSRVATSPAATAAAQSAAPTARKRFDRGMVGSSTGGGDGTVSYRRSSDDGGSPAVPRRYRGVTREPKPIEKVK